MCIDFCRSKKTKNIERLNVNERKGTGDQVCCTALSRGLKATNSNFEVLQYFQASS